MGDKFDIKYTLLPLDLQVKLWVARTGCRHQQSQSGLQCRGLSHQPCVQVWRAPLKPL